MKRCLGMLLVVLCVWYCGAGEGIGPVFPVPVYLQLSDRTTVPFAGLTPNGIELPPDCDLPVISGGFPLTVRILTPETGIADDGTGCRSLPTGSRLRRRMRAAPGMG